MESTDSESEMELRHQIQMTELDEEYVKETEVMQELGLPVSFYHSLYDKTSKVPPVTPTYGHSGHLYYNNYCLVLGETSQTRWHYQFYIKPWFVFVITTTLTVFRYLLENSYSNLDIMGGN